MPITYAKYKIHIDSMLYWLLYEDETIKYFESNHRIYITIALINGLPYRHLKKGDDYLYTPIQTKGFGI